MSGSGMMKDQHAAGICSLGGLATMKGREASLNALVNAMKVNIADADAAANEADFSRAILLALRLTKAACDAAVGIVSTVSGGQFKVLGAAYAGTTPAADLLGKAVIGQKIGGDEAFRAGVAGVAGAIGAIGTAKVNAKTVSKESGEGIVMIAEIVKLQSDVMVDAVNSDYTSLKRDMEAYQVKLASITLKAADYAGAGKVVDIARKVVVAGRALLAAVEEYKSGSIRQQMEGAKRMFKASMMQVERQLSELQAEITKCEIALVKDGSMTMQQWKEGLIGKIDMSGRLSPSRPTIRKAR